MKILISLSSPKLDVIKFTGTHGCYSAVTPDADSKALLSAVAHMLGVETDPDKLHCTVMYSEVAPKKGIGCNRQRVRKATVSQITHWDGHDNKGYLVALLDSPELQEEHARLKTLGCQPTFDDYKPHITLYAGIKMTPELQATIDSVMSAMPADIELDLTNQFIGDLS